MKNKILVIDDIQDNIELIIELLSSNYDIFAALNAEMGMELAKEEQIDLILLDIMMPNIDGFDMCQMLKDDKMTQNIPIIFLTAKSEENSIEKAYSLGGVDYIVKPFKPKELLSRIAKELKVQKLIYDLEKSKEKLQLLSMTDYMTKLYNRRYFLKHSHDALQKVKKSIMNASVLMIDIDKFKNINDKYGHEIGDKVLISFADILHEITREKDIACRWGGEEFVLLLYNTPVDIAVKTAQRIRTIIKELGIKIDEERNLNITVSIGVSCLNRMDTGVENAIERADKALYCAKDRGRDKVCSFLEL